MRARKKEREGGGRERKYVKKREGKRVRAESKKDPSLIIHIKSKEHLAAQSFMSCFCNVFSFIVSMRYDLCYETKWIK